MASEWILAVDQGTTNTKALLFDEEGGVVFKSASSVDLIQPLPGYVEQDPIALWRSTCEVMRACALHAKRSGGKIAGIAISNQRETAVVWRPGGNADVSAMPVCNAISWQCRRSSAICSKHADDAESIQRLTGLPLDPLLSATKWSWVLNEHPSLRADAEQGKVLFGTIDSWLLYNLTSGEVHATDLTNASRTALLNLASLEWGNELLKLFEIPRKALPRIQRSSSIFGECRAISELAGVPIVAMIGDSHAALVGHANYQSGTTKATYGTGSSLMMITPKLSTAQSTLARTIAWSLPGTVQFALEGNIAMSGAALQWVGEFLGLKNPVEDAADLADTVTDAAGMVFVPAMVGLGAPYWDSAARGLIANLERAHTSAHLARAALDAIAMQVADVLEAMETAAEVQVASLMADGGATRNKKLMQLQADVLAKPVWRSAQEELSARGAAMLGGLSIGWWPSLDSLESLPKRGDWLHPNPNIQGCKELRKSWKAAIDRTRMTPLVASAHF